LKTGDGQEIGAWLVRGDPQKGCALLLHGNGRSRRQMLPVMQYLTEAHFTVLAVNLRAHGDSTGEINDLGWSARHDVTAAVEFLEHECPQRPIYVVGRSLGAAAAIFASQELKGRVAGYFLEQPYKDLKSATWNRLQHYLPPVLDWIAYGGLRLWAPVFLPVAADQLSPHDHIQDIPESVPVVFVTGSADRHAHLDEVTAMYRRIQSHAKLVVFDGAQHVDLDRANPELYRTTLLNFLDNSTASDRRTREWSSDRRTQWEPLPVQPTTRRRPLGRHLTVDENSTIWNGKVPVGVWGIDAGGMMDGRRPPTRPAR
jgi:alpha-beta hydrolase superfamily lysophospholipase